MVSLKGQFKFSIANQEIGSDLQSLVFANYGKSLLTNEAIAIPSQRCLFIGNVQSPCIVLYSSTTHPVRPNIIKYWEAKKKTLSMNHEP
jgi:hypothetical protein